MGTVAVAALWALWVVFLVGVLYAGAWTFGYVKGRRSRG